MKTFQEYINEAHVKAMNLAQILQTKKFNYKVGERVYLLVNDDWKGGDFKRGLVGQGRGKFTAKPVVVTEIGNFGRIKFKEEGKTGEWNWVPYWILSKDEFKSWGMSGFRLGGVGKKWNRDEDWPGDESDRYFIFNPNAPLYQDYEEWRKNFPEKAAKLKAELEL